MASAKLVCISLRKTLSPKNLLIRRRIGWMSNFQTLCHYSTPERDLSQPIKYTTSEASKLSFGKEMGLEENPSSNTLWYQRYVIMASVAAFLIYFCMLREENDIDEMLKGNPEYQSDYVKLMELQGKLHYCKVNKLPTERLQQKIDEIKNRLGVY